MTDTLPELLPAPDTRQARRASMRDELRVLRRHNAALSLMLRGILRSQGGRIAFAKVYVEGQPAADISALDAGDRVVVVLEEPPRS